MKNNRYVYVIDQGLFWKVISVCEDVDDIIQTGYERLNLSNNILIDIPVELENISGLTIYR